MGGIISGIGKAQQMEAQAKADDFNAQIALANKDVANQNRGIAIQTAAADYADSRRASMRNNATIKAAFGTSGLSGGSQLDVLADAATEQNTSSARILDEGRNQNRKSALQMLGFDNNAILDKMGAESNRSGEGLAIMGGVIDTVSQFASMGSGMGGGM